MPRGRPARTVSVLSVRPVARNVEALAFFVRAGDIVGHVVLFRIVHIVDATMAAGHHAARQDVRY
jgi:hypothetical protein